jgi:hypothetical protein
LGVSWKADSFLLSLGILIKQIKIMKKFKITKTQPSTIIWTYYVEAESEEQAMSKVENNPEDFDDCITEDGWYEDDTNYEIEEDK